MGNIKTNVIRILDKEKLDYQITTYTVEDGKIDGEAVAQKIGKPLEQVFKTLVTCGHSKAYYVFVIPVGEELDLKKASRVAGEKNIEMLPMKELQKTTGYIRGGCSPIGMKKDFKTYVHITACELPQITVSGGKVGIQVTLSPTSLAKLLQGNFADLVK